MTKQLSGIVLAAAGGALLVIGLFLAYYLTGERYGARIAEGLSAEDFTLVAGQGGVTAQGLEIRQVPKQGVAFASSGAIDLDAARYRTLVWSIAGAGERADVRFIWATADTPATMRELRLQPAESGGGRVDLAAQPHWRGAIAGVGIMVHGTLTEPVVIRRLEFRPPPPPAGALLHQLRTEWATLGGGWSQRSPNFIFGAPAKALLPPPVAAAAWIVLSALLYAALAWAWRRPLTLLPFAVFFMAGWLVLDARWQWDLGKRLQTTQERFAGKSWPQKRLAEEDGAFYQFMNEVRQKLPAEPARVFVLSADPGEGTRYLRSRAQYHLLPHNVFSILGQLSDSLRSGDYLLILQPVAGLRYQADAGRLQGGGFSLPAELLYNAPPGALFRMRG